MIKVVGGCILDSSMTRDSKRRTVDGLSTTCGTCSDHVNKFGRPPTAVPYQKLSTSQAMPDSRMESQAPSRKSPRLDPRFFEEGGILGLIEKGGDMKHHRVDLHKKYATISVRNEAGTEESSFEHRRTSKATWRPLVVGTRWCWRALRGALYWAEKIQVQGSSCIVIDAYRFRVIRDSWQETDKRDAANLSLALWLASRSGEMKLPV